MTKICIKTNPISLVLFWWRFYSPSSLSTISFGFVVTIECDASLFFILFGMFFKVAPLPLLVIHKHQKVWPFYFWMLRDMGSCHYSSNTQPLKDPILFSHQVNDREKNSLEYNFSIANPTWWKVYVLSNHLPLKKWSPKWTFKTQPTDFS